jgi:Holliday junction resolvase RusA-like endonuclease
MSVYIISGNPVAQGRPKFFRRGSHVGCYDPKKSKTYKETVQAQLIGKRPITFDLPISVSFTFMIERPKTVKRALPTCKPDLSNFIKLIEDAANGILWADDSLIVNLSARKEYADIGRGGVKIEIKEVVDEVV